MLSTKGNFGDMNSALTPLTLLAYVFLLPGIADLVLSNFLYTKVCKSDDSVEHLLELGM
jgi:hypothetical protein